MYAWNQLTLAKTAVEWICHFQVRHYLLNYALSLFCSDQLKSETSFSVLKISLELTMAGAHDGLRDTDDQPAAVPRDAGPSR